MDDRPPEIPGYEVLRLLGKGGMGAVYLARHQELGRDVALKVMHARLADERSRTRFLREAKAMNRFRHRNLVRLLDFGQIGEDLWLVLEHIRGDALDRFLEGGGAMDPAQAADAMLQVAEGLAVLHAGGVLHRDIKPANIMLEEGGRAVLMDFGLAWSSDYTQVTKTGHLLGTPHYLAPEVMVRGRFDAKADWYAWAYTWSELVAGARPRRFQEVVAALSAGEVLELPPPRAARGELDPRHAEVITRAGAHYKRRLGSLAEIRAVLAGDDAGPEEATEVVGSADLVPEVVPPAPPEAEVPPPRDPKVGRAAAFLVLFLLGVLSAGPFSTQAPAPLPPGASRSPLEVGPAVRGLLSAAVEGTARDAGAVRAVRRSPGGDVPVPVYARDGTRFVAWVAGLRAEDDGEVEIRVPGAEPVVVRFGSADPAALPLLPEPLRRFRARPDDDFVRGYLEALEEVAGIPRALKSATEVFDEFPRFSDIPHGAWTTILSWLEAGGFRAYNLGALMYWGKSRIPPEVAWHLLHRRADPTSPLNAWTDGRRSRFPTVSIVHAPPLAWSRLAEWYGEYPGARPHLLRVMAAFSELLTGTKGWEPFPYPIPGWSGEPARDPAALPGPLGRLVDLARRGAEGDAAAGDRLLDAARGEGPEAAWALALLPALRRRELLPELVGRLEFEEGDLLHALDAALEAMRTEQGLFTFASEGLLYRIRIPPSRGRVEEVEAPKGIPVTYRPELGTLTGYFTEVGVRIRIRFEDGRVETREVTTGSGLRVVEGDEGR